jgi:hypothetical protein
MLIDGLEGEFRTIATCKVIASQDVTIPFVIESFEFFGYLPPELDHLRYRKDDFDFTKVSTIGKQVRFEQAAEMYRRGNFIWKRWLHQING